MNNEKLLEKISSNYIFENIFDYISNEKFKFKIFVHSKLFQKKLDLELKHYKLHYINQFGLRDMNTYFSNDDYENYDKDYLTKILKDDLSNKKIDMNKMKTVLFELFEDYKNDKDYNYFDLNEKNLDIYSPFFDVISKTELYEKMYTIPIPVEIIKKLNLKNDYISAFNKMNESNGKYHSITLYYKECDDIKLLKELNIDFSKVKRFNLIFIGSKEHIKSYILFKDLFSIKNIENLTYLNLDLNANIISNESFEKINDCKSLKILKITYLLFDCLFLLKLKNLEYLRLSRCEKIGFDEDSFLNIKKLKIDTCFMLSTKSLLKMPNLEECQLIDPDFTYSYMLDFSSMQKLKELTSKVSDFILLENSNIEDVVLGSAFSYEDETKMFEKFISFTKLNKIECYLKFMDDEEILKIKGENKSVKEIFIHWKNEEKDAFFFNQQQKFPNLEIFSIESYSSREGLNYTTIEIKEEENSKIKDLTININCNLNLKLNSGLFENLNKFYLGIDGDLKDLETIFPIFNSKCQKVFKSLITFGFKIENNMKDIINMSILKNIYNNLDKMPKLENLILNFFVEGLKKEKDFYMKFIEKILSMQLFYINIKLFGEEENHELYGYKELKELYPEKYFKNLKQVVILKFNESI